MNQTAAINALPRDKQEILSRVLMPIVSRGDPSYNEQRIKIAEQVIAFAQAAIENAKKPVEDKASMSVVGVFMSPVERRFLIFTSTHEAALSTAGQSLTLDPSKNTNQLVRSWNTFVNEQVTGEKSIHHITDDQRAFYGTVYHSGREPIFHVVARDVMDREQRKQSRESETAKLVAAGWSLASKSWN